MTMRNAGLIKTYNAAGTINPSRFVKFSTTDKTVVQSAAAADLSIGVSDYNPNGSTVASGERVDVLHDGVATVTYGGDVTRGQLVMSDADGKAITATAAAGTNVRTCGIAMVSGASGDLGAVLLIPGSFQG